MNVSESLAIAFAHHQAGRLDEAQPLYAQILRVDPQCAGAWHLLGMLLHQLGEHATARDCLHRAVVLAPHEVEFFTNLAVVQRALGDLPAAASTLQQALARRPDFVRALNTLGVVQLEQKQAEPAVETFRRVLALQPDHLLARTNLGNALKQLARNGEAVAEYRRVLDRQPQHFEALHNLGAVQLAQLQPGPAAESLRAALQLRPNAVETLSNLASAEKQLGHYDEAAALYDQALDLAPEHAESLLGLANLLTEIDDLQTAIPIYERALAAKPDLIAAWFGRGNTHKQLGQLERAADCFLAILDQQPDSAPAYNNLGNVRLSQARLEEAVACYEKAVALCPSQPQASSNLVYVKQFVPGATLADLAAAQARWDEHHGRPLREQWPQFANVRDPARRLRLGFVSPNFYRHPCGYFIVRCLEHLDREQVETFCYADRAKKDELTHRIAAAVDHWCESLAFSDEKLVERMREDGIDLAFAFAGHTAANRLAMFARKAAPVQVMWTGGGPVGITAIQYLLADPFTVPPELEPGYRERIARLPTDYVCYDPPGYAPAVGPPPSSLSGHVTFGSFNNPIKLHPGLVAAWAEILRRVPDSRLLLKYPGFDDATLARRVAELLGAEGIDASRLELEGGATHDRLFDAYNRVDVGLDAFPFSGGLTTIEALLMGVPVVTWPGVTFASRTSLAHIRAIDLPDLVADSCADYIDRNVAWALDVDRRAAARREWRDRIAASPLCDGRRFASDFQTACRAMWSTWCATGS